MKCVKCGRPATIDVQNLAACDSCFMEIIEKRVRKEIRTHSLIERKDRLLLIDDASEEAALNRHLLNRIFDETPLEIEERKSDYVLGEAEGDYDGVVIPWNADMEGAYLLECLMTGAEPVYLGHFMLEKLYIKPLLPVLASEVRAFCEILGLKYTGTDMSRMQAELDALEKEYPSIKFSLLRSARELSKH